MDRVGECSGHVWCNVKRKGILQITAAVLDWQTADVL